MHWPDGACNGRAGDCVRLIGIKVRASGANPPAPYDGCTCCHQNPSLCITWTTTGPTLRQIMPVNRAAGQGEGYLTYEVSAVSRMTQTR